MPSTLNEPTCGPLPVSTKDRLPWTFTPYDPSAGVNNYFMCIRKGLKAFSRVTPPIRMHDQAILTRSFDPMMAGEVGSWDKAPIFLLHTGQFHFFILYFFN